MPHIILKSSLDHLSFLDSRDEKPIFNPETLSVTYTPLGEDIRKTRIYETSPYESKKEELPILKKNGDVYSLSSRDQATVLEVTPLPRGIRLDLSTDRTDFGEFGLNLPFNFMGKKNGGGYARQFQFSSPYRSKDETYKYIELDNVDGNHLFLLFLSPADGWKIDYSPYVGGAYFVNLKALASFDPLYRKGKPFQNKLSLALLAVKDLDEGLAIATKMLGVPAIRYEKSYALDGKGEVEVIGDADHVLLEGEGILKTLPIVDGKAHYEGVLGKAYLTPIKNGKKGIDASVFGFGDFRELAERCNERILACKGLPTYDNLTEWQGYVPAMLRYMLRYGRRADYDAKIAEFMKVCLAKEEKDAIPDLTIFDKPQNGYPAYHIYRSSRIQEQCSGITLLLDAYRLYGDEIYYEYATRALDTFLEVYQKEDGRIETCHGGVPEDYTTVTCLIIPVVDMAVFCRKLDPERAKRYQEAAERMARHVYDRGFHFPTEGGDTDEAEERMEDGSISCSALTLLYYCAKIKRDDAYLKKAKEFLDFHEAWVMKSYDANVYRSSLRWWETRWEGDKDGPAICCGHGWTAWRGEADYWYGVLAHDDSHIEKALCSFTTNFAKIDETGKNRANYHMDYITGGGFFYNDACRYEVAPRLPKTEDFACSWYPWVRAYETFLR